MKKQKKNLNGAGFYIALCCCVMVIALVGYAGNSAKQNNKQSQMASDPVHVEEQPTVAPVKTAVPVITEKPEVKATAMPKATAQPKKPTQAVISNVKAEEPAKTTEPTKAPEAKFTAPVLGTILENFSEDKLVFNTILSDWRTHDGVDIKAEAGTEVKAAIDGVVYEVFADALGESIVIDSQNGFMTLYAGLENTDTVAVGNKVKAGDVIGKVSKELAGENVRETHLHFEIIKDGQNVNPMDYVGFAQ